MILLANSELLFGRGWKTPTIVVSASQTADRRDIPVPLLRFQPYSGSVTLIIQGNEPSLLFFAQLNGHPDGLYHALGVSSALAGFAECHAMIYGGANDG